MYMCRITSGTQYKDSQWMRLVVEPEDPAVVARKRQELEMLQQEVIYQRDGFDDVDRGVGNLHVADRHHGGAAGACGAHGAGVTPGGYGKRQLEKTCNRDGNYRLSACPGQVKLEPDK